MSDKSQTKSDSSKNKFYGNSKQCPWYKYLFILQNCFKTFIFILD
jgi:hypothetical protein